MEPPASGLCKKEEPAPFYTHIQAHTYTCMHTIHTHTHIHAYKHTSTHIRMHMRTHTHTHKCACTCSFVTLQQPGRCAWNPKGALQRAPGRLLHHGVCLCARACVYVYVCVSYFKVLFKYSRGGTTYFLIFYIHRVGQNHIYIQCICFFWQGNHQIHGHIRYTYTVATFIYN